MGVTAYYEPQKLELLLIWLILYSFSWLIFAVLHSLLARPYVQLKLETFLGRFYRLSYNLLAAVKIAAVLSVGRLWVNDTRFAFLESKVALVAGSAVQLVGLTVILLALLSYDIGRFSGVTQIVTGERVSSLSNEPLQRRRLNRWMRHPLYTGAFLVLWGGLDSPFSLLTAILGTVYLLIGTSFEERKLVGIYGEEYRTYQREVPRYFPQFTYSLAQYRLRKN